MLKKIARRVASHPRVYELIQNLLGRRATWRKIESFIPATHDRWLDIGSSSGSFPARDRQPFHLDIDILPLHLQKRRRGSTHVVAGDAAALPFQSRSFDLATCFAVSHHLDDQALAKTLAEIARVTTGRLIFFDAVRIDSRLTSRLLWRYDRGEHPRTRETLTRMVSESFEIEDEIAYRIAHEYWLAVAVPRRSETA